MSGVRLCDWFAASRDGADTGATNECVGIFARTEFPACGKATAFGGDEYVPFCDEAMEAGALKLYVPSLDLPDKTLDKLIDYTLDKGARLAVRCCATLTEAGVIDGRFGKNPVMLLHEFGLLDCSTVVSGVYLDKDDLSLLSQQSVRLVVLPSEDAGYGHGIAPVVAALDRGVEVRVGSGDGVYNHTRSPLYEVKLLRLLVSAQMNRRDAVSVEQLAKMCLPGGASEVDRKATAKLITE